MPLLTASGSNLGSSAALLTRISSRPNVERVFSTSAFTSSGWVMLVGTARALYPLFVSDSATACEAEAFKSTTTTDAPASASVLQNSVTHDLESFFEPFTRQRCGGIISIG